MIMPFIVYPFSRDEMRKNIHIIQRERKKNKKSLKSKYEINMIRIRSKRVICIVVDDIYTHFILEFIQNFPYKSGTICNGKKNFFLESHYVESQRIVQGSGSQENEKRIRFEMKTKKIVLMHICKFSFFIVSYFHESSERIIILKVFFSSHIHVVCVCVCAFYRCLSSFFILNKMDHMSIRFL